MSFIRREDPNVLPAVEALFLAQTQGAAARSLGITEAQFNRTHNRLLQLGRCFLSGEPAPRQRKHYKKRNKRLNLAAIPKKTETPPTPSAASNLGIAFAKERGVLEQFVPVPLLSNPISSGATLRSG